MYCLDTNAIIYYLKGDENAVSFLNNIFDNRVPVYVSTITETELLSFEGMDLKEEELIENILRIFSIIPLDSNIAKIAGYIRRTCSLNIADSVIAATAIFTGGTLVTRNIKHFRKIPNLAIQKV